MATNDFLPFAYGGGANVLSQSAYAALTTLLSGGYQSGVANSAQMNKTWRQSSIMAAVLAQFAADYSGNNSTDDGTTATLEANLVAAIRNATKTGVILADTGAANAYTAANVPPLVSGTWVDGVVQEVKIAHANTGASTYAPDGLTAIPIYGLGLQPLQGGELALNGTAVMMRLTIPGVNSGNPIAVLMECAGGAQQIAPATQSQHAVQLGQTFNTIGRRVQGQLGNVNATTPLTKFDLSADAVVFVDANGRSYSQFGLTTTTVDLGLAGPVANGRDQAAVFTPTQWIRLYWVFNPTTSTRSLIASAALPTVGPTLPAGYTAWAYATTLNWNASSNIVPGFVEGNMFLYDIQDNSITRVISGGQATTMTTVVCSAFIPPERIKGFFNFNLTVNGGLAAVNGLVRRTGSTQTGQNVVTCTIQVASGPNFVTSINWTDFPLNAAQSFDYRLSITPSSGGLSVEVRGYTTANGDV